MPVDNELYNRLSDTWWSDENSLSMLRSMLNPSRFGYFQEVLTEKLRIDPQGTKALDVGCGGGLLAEEFARLGCQVTGIDPSEPSLAVARAHAKQSGLDIDYQVGAGENLPFADESFDIVYCCDVLEHVDNLEKVIVEIARVLKKDGVFLYDTINRTFLSKLVVIKLFQEWKPMQIAPPGLHDWNMFINPHELQSLMQRYGLKNQDVKGLTPAAHPLAMIASIWKQKRGKMSLYELGTHLKLEQSKNISMSYVGYAIKISR